MASSSDTGTPAPRQPSKECPICLKTFHVPKILKCGHSVCSACVDVLKSNNNAEILCPVCRGKTNANVDGGLPTNFALQSLLDEEKQKKRKYACQQCSRRHLLDEMWTCVKCGLTLVCANCIMRHHRDHDVRALKEILEQRQVRFTDWLREQEATYDQFTDRQTSLNDELYGAHGDAFQCFSDLRTKLMPLLNKAIDAATAAGNALVQEARNADVCSLTASGQYDTYLKKAPAQFQKLAQEQEAITADIRMLHDMVQNAGNVMKELLVRIQRRIESMNGAAVANPEDGLRNEASGGASAAEPVNEDPGWWSALENELAELPPPLDLPGFSPVNSEREQVDAGGGAAAAALPRPEVEQENDGEMAGADYDTDLDDDTMTVWYDVPFSGAWRMAYIQRQGGLSPVGFGPPGAAAAAAAPGFGPVPMELGAHAGFGSGPMPSRGRGTVVAPSPFVESGTPAQPSLGEYRAVGGIGRGTPVLTPRSPVGQGHRGRGRSMGVGRGTVDTIEAHLPRNHGRPRVPRDSQSEFW